MINISEHIFEFFTNTLGLNETLFKVVAYFIPAVFLLMAMVTIAGLLTYAERRVAAKIQSRIGPNRVGPQGLLQWVADGLKLVMKEDLIPADADSKLFRIAPYLVMIGMILSMIVVPFSSKIVVSDFNIGVFYILAVSSLGIVGIVMSGWASNNKWSLLGGIRSAAQIVSYEIPAGLAIICAILVAGSLSTQEIILSQGALPWDWLIFHNPGTLGAFFIYFTAGLAEINRVPFDIPEAESELVSGYTTEYSSIRFAFFFMAEFANIVVVSAVCVIVFLGGWQVPGISPDTHIWWHHLLMISMFLFKTFTLVYVVIWLRWTLPRLRVDQLMTMCWKYMVPIAFLCILISGIFMVALKGESIFRYIMN